MKRLKTKARFEDYLNSIYRGDGYGIGNYKYLGKAGLRLVRQGKLGTALRRYDPIAFEVGYYEWEGGKA